jgi:hypothetical protein
MTVIFRDNRSGLGDFAQAMITAPILYRHGLSQGQDALALRDSRMSAAAKSLAEAEDLQRKFKAQDGLGGALETIYRFNAGLPEFDRPPEGQGTGFFATREPDPITPDRFAKAQSMFLRANPGNADQASKALLNFQTGGFRNQAVTAARGGDSPLAVMLNAIGAGTNVPDLYGQNAAGSVLDKFTGAVNQDNPLAVSAIAANNARARKVPSLPTELRKMFELPILDRAGGITQDPFTGKVTTQLDSKLLSDFSSWWAQNRGITDPYAAISRWMLTLPEGERTRIQQSVQTSQVRPPESVPPQAGGALGDALSLIADKLGLSGGGTAAAQPAPNPGNLPAPRSRSEYDALPPGTIFIDPNGQRRRKP